VPCRADVKRQGFTLVELLITMVLISIIAIMLSNFIANWLQVGSVSRARADLLANAESALDTANTDIRLSGGANLYNRWADANAPGADDYSWTSDSDTLILAKAAVDSSQNVIFADPAKYISQKDNVIYYLDGQTLYRRVIKSDDSTDAAVTTCPPPGASGCPADRVIATGVSSFNVKYFNADNEQVAPDDARSIQLAITLQNTVGGKAINASYDTRMVFRNE
jgi:prepilin-type N-terminal cleavage/methylation domain-containing protein